MKSSPCLYLAVFLVACGPVQEPAGVSGKGDQEIGDAQTCDGYVMGQHFYTNPVCLHACQDDTGCASATEGRACASTEERQWDLVAGVDSTAPEYQMFFAKVCGCNQNTDCSPGQICQGVLFPHCVDACETLADCKQLSEHNVHCDLSSGECLTKCPLHHIYDPVNGECLANTP